MKEVSTSQVDEAIRDEVERVLFEVANELVNEMKQEAPVNSGRLRQSIQILKQSRDGFYVGTNLKYAPYIQYGTRPHYPPLEPLKKWVRRKLGAEESVAYAIQQKIGRKGTDANPFVTRAIENLIRDY